MGDGPETNFEQRGDETSAGTRRGHDARAAEADADRATGDSNVSDRHGSEGDQSGAGQAGAELATQDVVAEVEEILEGEIDDRRVSEIISRESWAGPLPPPAALAAYERVLPGAADRAFRLAERTQDLRHEREQTVRTSIEGEIAIQTTIADADRDALKRGQYLAAGISVLIGVLSFAGLFLTPWAAVGFAVPLAQVATAIVRTVSDGPDRDDDDDKDDPGEPGRDVVPSNGA
ncbi:DUF2335 domain-containing protein [Mycobacterium sp. 852002-51961_SCH5331710]|uniref:DUF2335 domain-containing protein n=1 Tax=Mycobacterium sp. 852002-51961_SCH5331710 TaxID=1834105 RepID=UPI0007FF3308|nr:DUF2335 domain-containing protein [Mycobacterium sp. 852002-51961_SCH5331710]OBB41240.1 hypothetical protein A5752_08175 [Mycobacterium sp. 852002-51961_SCH5331710]